MTFYVIVYMWEQVTVAYRRISVTSLSGMCITAWGSRIIDYIRNKAACLHNDQFKWTDLHITAVPDKD